MRKELLDDSLTNPTVNEQGCTGLSQECPTPTIKIENSDGVLLVCGVLIGPNFRLSLTVFGGIFIFIGAILTIIGFSQLAQDEGQNYYENRIKESNNARVLGPICIVFGVAMLIFAVILKHQAFKTKLKQTRIGFYCPVHGDFYPLSPGVDPKDYVFPEKGISSKCWIPCLKNRSEIAECAEKRNSKIPSCPYNLSASPRSSIDSQYQSSPNLYPAMPSVSIGSGYLTVTTDETFGSIRSLSIVPNDVACFPTNFYSHSTPPSTPSSPMYSLGRMNKRLSCPTLPEIGAISPFKIDKLKEKASIMLKGSQIKMVRPVSEVVKNDNTNPPIITVTSSVDDIIANSAKNSQLSDEVKKRKSVSIVLPALDSN